MENFLETSKFLLLVEDEPTLAIVLEEALTDGGYEVVWVENGDAAMNLCNSRAGQIAGLITDIRLGAGSDGWEVARHGRELCPGLPIVYISGASAADWLSKGVPKSLMLQKPFANAQLVTAISSLLL